MVAFFPGNSWWYENEIELWLFSRTNVQKVLILNLSYTGCCNDSLIDLMITTDEHARTVERQSITVRLRLSLDSVRS